jgi:hypothetical protein
MNKPNVKKRTTMSPRRNDPLALASGTPNVMKRSYKDVMMEKNLEKMRVLDNNRGKVRTPISYEINIF